MRTYSNSQLSTYEQCPFKYKLRYLDNIKRKFETAESLLGTIVHQTLKKCHDDYRFGKLSSLNTILAYYYHLWKQRWDDSVLILKKGMTQESYRALGEKMIGTYYRHYSPFNTDVTIDTELLVNFFLDDDHKYCMIGYIDRLSKGQDGVMQIHDYKTSVHLPSQEDVDNDRQLALYQIGVQQKWHDIKDIRLIWNYLVFDIEMVSSRSPEAIRQLMSTTMDLIDQIRTTQDFLPRESGLCKWCEYPDLCPLRKHFIMVQSLAENEYLNEPGVILVDKYTALKKDAKGSSEELEKVRMEILEYAHKEGIEVIRGSSNKVRIQAMDKVRLAESDDVEGGELGSIIKEAGKWVKVFQLDMTEIARIVEKSLWSQDLMNQVMKYSRDEMRDSIKISKLQDSERIL